MARHNYNNHRGQPWNLGGSDSALFFSRFASDVGGNATYKSEFAATGDGFQLSLNSQQKMAVSGLYFTAEGQASGVKVSNSSSDHLVSLDKSIIEGRNGGAPCLRDLLRVTGGRVRVTDTLLNYANKSGSTEQGAPIVVTGGYLSIEACDHNRASGVSNSKPVVFVANGAKFRGYGCTSNDGSPWVVVAQASADVPDRCHVLGRARLSCRLLLSAQGGRRPVTDGNRPKRQARDALGDLSAGR
jgi:hypothetical protein